MLNFIVVGFVAHIAFTILLNEQVSTSDISLTFLTVKSTLQGFLNQSSSMPMLVIMKKKKKVNNDNHNSNHDNSNNGDNNKIPLPLFINTFYTYTQCHVSGRNYLLVSQTSCLTPRTVMGVTQRDGTLISQGHTAITPIYFLITKNRGHLQGLIMRYYQPVIRWKQVLVK